MPLGDPGYLAPSLLGVTRSAQPSFRVGLVGRSADRGNPFLARLLLEEGVADLDVAAPPDVFLRRMAECDVVISTDLHGLIFAEAMGTPNLWLTTNPDADQQGFEFVDWFSTTRRPQPTPHRLMASDTTEVLAQRARLHESEIDAGDLMAAFPHDQLESVRELADRVTLNVRACRARPTPVFFISYNRGAMLKAAIDGVRKQSRRTEIIVHDNGSTDPATLAILDELEATGVKVVRSAAIHSADELNLVDQTVQAHFTGWAEPCRYVVSDCDIDLSAASPAALDVYDAMLSSIDEIECVGPMLRIEDVPRTYPLHNRVMNRHIDQFWRKSPDITTTALGEVAFQRAPFDTTFALHRAAEPFRRMKSGARLYEPYEARHLDWYRAGDPGVYATSSSAAISHWDNLDEYESHRSEELEYDSFIVVRHGRGAALEIQTVSLNRHKP
jgi:hypothetical protein